MSVGETLEIRSLFEKEMDYVIEHKSKAHGLKMSGNLGAFAFAMAVDQAAADHYLALVSGQGLTEDSPLAQLRGFLTGPEAVLPTRGTDRGLAELVLQAIFLHGRRKPTVLEPSTEGAEHYRALNAERVAKIKTMFELPQA